MEISARPSVNRDMFDDNSVRPFVRRCRRRVPGRGAATAWGVYQRNPQTRVETCLGIFLYLESARDFAARLWGH